MRVKKQTALLIVYKTMKQFSNETIKNMNFSSIRENRKNNK